jgi:hypothetical protein
MAGEPVELDWTKESGAFVLAWLDSENGELKPSPGTVGAGKIVTLAPPVSDTKRPWVAWLVRR